MWRNIYYNKKKSEIHETTWNEEGERILNVSKFKPFLFTETKKKTKYKSIYGTYLEPQIFENDSKRYWFVENKEEKIFYNLPPEQQYAIAKYREVPQEEFTKNPIRTFFLDIEAPAKLEFPHAKDAKYEIDLMTIYDSLTGVYHMWGKEKWNKEGTEKILKELNEKKGREGKLRIVKPEEIQYYHIENEKERLEHMLSFWEDNIPEIMTGWNSSGYDLPYIVNRLKLILGGKEYLRLSPFKVVSSKDGFDKFGNPEIKYNIHGVNHMDYMDVFKTFTFKAERDSWKLDDVGSDILDCGKVEHPYHNLYDLARADWDTYSLYNLVDVALLVSLDKELDFIETSRETAYEGFANYVDSLGKIKAITGSVAKLALDSDVFIETRRRSTSQAFEGGFVKQPKPALVTNLFTYDVTSLYPSVMINLNTSLETKVGSIEGEDGEFTFYTEWGERKKVRTEHFIEELKELGYSCSKAGVIFDLNRKGVVIDFVKKQFANKTLFTKKAREAEEAGDLEAAKIWNRKAKITKIFVNSCYGIISAGSSPLFDLDIARSITLTGQNVTKTSINYINDLFFTKFSSKEEAVIGADTDSCFVCFDSVVEKTGKKFFENEKLTKFGLQFSEYIGSLINNTVNEWAVNELACVNPTFNFGREKAAKTALYFAKKQYAYYVLNNEGFDLKEDKRMKYTGLKVIKSEFSPMVKKMFNELYFECLGKYLEMGHSENRKHLVKIVRKHKEKFFSSSFYEISKRQKANNLNLYENGGTQVNKKGETVIVEGFRDTYEAGLRCPISVKSCIFHNNIIKEKKLMHKYQLHQGGVKAMWSYVKPNEYGIEMIAGNNDILPEEFGLEIDYDRQWEKLYMVVARQLFDTVDWIFPNLKHEEMVDFDEMFG